MKKGLEDCKSTLKWEVRCRLEFIETRLFWDGQMNRGDLMKHFGISGAQATTDISRYSKMAPENLTYDRNEKTYVAGENFQPILIQPQAKDFLTQLSQQEMDGLDTTVPVEVLPLPDRKVDVDILRQVVKVVRNSGSLEIRYQSMSKPDPSWRIFAPHAFAFNGMRWHVRAFCFRDNRFKDFLLARILDIGKERPGIVSAEDDQEWGLHVDVDLVPHPGLSDSQKKVIEADYGMTEGLVKISVRQALLPYILKRLNLVDERKKPEEQQVILLNRAEVLSLHTR